MSRHATHTRAMLYMLIAVALFALMDAGLKLLAPHYPPLQVAMLRGASALPLVLAWTLLSVGTRALLRVHWRLHLLRGVLGVAMMFGFVYGLRTLPLSTAYAITFVAPLLVTAMAVPFLGEKVGLRRWTAIAIGLVGVLVVLRPTGAGMLTLGGLAILLAAICYAASAITVRMLAQRDSTQAMVFWLMVIIALGSGVLSAHEWVAIRAQDAWVIAGIGITGTLAQIALTEAFRRGEASLIAPLEYTALVWGVLLDVTLWGVLPDSVTWLGAAIIVASGLYLLRREKTHAVAVPP
ncbi:DMT family transporter [Luteimonas sp. SX5]|uniref:DMT family transporter n=1 Tax=Luteimonas galliterrae TaxID=2940486 RepID=A0ABT0ML84_9GAMM|nr:DMT family transporter [Luteimonas galliterrae]MCL1635649.1 DMT family transporter [Luteimonas galliterrae]